MKKIISLLLIILALSLLSSCGGGEDSSTPIENNTEKSNSTEINTKEDSSPEPEEILIADNEYITATFEKIYDATALGLDGIFYIDINVKNNTDKEIEVVLDKASVNDEIVPLVMSGVPLCVQPEKSGRNSFIISFEQLSIDNIADVKNIEFDLVILDTETFEEITRIEGISLEF